MALENRDYEQKIGKATTLQAQAGQDLDIVGASGQAVNIKNGAGQTAVRVNDDKSIDTNDINCSENLVVTKDSTLKGNVILGDDPSDTITINGTMSFADLSVTGDTTLGDSASDTVTINGTPTIKENTKLEKNLTVDGSSILGDSASDVVIIQGTPTIKENASFEKDIEVKGDSTLGENMADTVTLKGVAVAKENLTAEKDLTVNGNTTLGETASETLTVKATPTFKENTTFEKDVTINGSSSIGNGATDTVLINGTPTFKENTKLEKDLTVDGDTKLNGNVTLGDNASDIITINGTMTFTDLGVTGNTTLGDSSSDTVTINATPTLKENTLLEKNLTVLGNTTLGDNASDTMVVNATPTFKEDVTIEKNLDVAGVIKENGNEVITFADDYQGITKVASSTRPTTVFTGELWRDTTNNKTYYYDGTDNLEAGTTRPAGVASGDSWFSLTSNQIQEYSGSLDFDRLESDRVFQVGTDDDKVAGSKYGFSIYDKYTDTSNRSKLDFTLSDGIAKISVRSVGGLSADKAKLELKQDGNGYIGDKLIVTENYDPTVTNFSTTTNSDISPYLTYLGLDSATECYDFFLGVVRIGNTLFANAKFSLKNINLDSTSDANWAIYFNLMEFIKDKGWFDSKITVKSYGSGNYFFLDSSSDYTQQSLVSFTKPYTDGSRPNSWGIFNNEAKTDIPATTLTKVQVYISATIPIEDN